MLELSKQGYDVVYGKRVSRDGESWFKRLTAYSFYRILAFLVDVDIPTDTGDFRLISRKAADALLSMPEEARFIRGMVAWLATNKLVMNIKVCEVRRSDQIPNKKDDSLYFRCDSQLLN